MAKASLSEIYLRYKEQIDTLASIPDMKDRQLARIVAWFYGGSEERWRKILASKTRKKKLPEDVGKLLQGLIKGKAKK
jgi:uncharacterized protein YfaQ (DUF2300 family)